MNNTTTNDIINTTLDNGHNEPVAVRVFVDDLSYTLEVNDFVANVWCEEYATLSAAIARLALLAACCEARWDKVFLTEVDQHEHHWREFEDTFLGVDDDV